MIYQNHHVAQSDEAVMVWVREGIARGDTMTATYYRMRGACVSISSARFSRLWKAAGGPVREKMSWYW